MGLERIGGNQMGSILCHRTRLFCRLGRRRHLGRTVRLEEVTTRGSGKDSWGQTKEA